MISAWALCFCLDAIFIVEGMLMGFEARNTPTRISASITVTSGLYGMCLMIHERLQ